MLHSTVASVVAFKPIWDQRGSPVEEGRHNAGRIDDLRSPQLQVQSFQY